MVAHLVHAQKVDSLRKEQASFKKRDDKMTLSLYERVIWDAQGNVRYDENIVSNLKLNSWLRGEGGIRFGHRPEKFDSYYHYKLELSNEIVLANGARFLFACQMILINRLPSTQGVITWR